MINKISMQDAKGEKFTFEDLITEMFKKQEELIDKVNEREEKLNPLTRESH